MKVQQNIPKSICALCVLLAMAWWFVFDSTRMDDLSKTLYVFFLPLTASPYIFWVIHKEGQEPDGYLEEFYRGHSWLMWSVRVFMMVVLSTLSSIAAIFMFGAFGLVASWLH